MRTVLHELTAIRAALDRTREQDAALKRERLSQLRRGVAEGYTVRDLAHAAGITRTRVQQLTGTGTGPRARRPASEGEGESASAENQP